MKEDKCDSHIKILHLTIVGFCQYTNSQHQREKILDKQFKRSRALNTQSESHGKPKFVEDKIAAIGDEAGTDLESGSSFGRVVLIQRHLILLNLRKKIRRAKIRPRIRWLLFCKANL